MRFTPKLALTTTAVLVAFGLLWVGFVESGRSQTTISRGSGAAVQSPHQLIAAQPMVALAVPGISQTGTSPATPQPKDNVLALAVSGSVIATLIMLALAIARFQSVHPTARPEMATSRRARLVTSGAPQL